MTIEFGPNIRKSRRGELQLWLEAKVDRPNDFYTALTSTRKGDYIYLRADWHVSKLDKNKHLTGDVYLVRSHCI